MTPRLPLGPHPYNPFCLGREPKARVATMLGWHASAFLCLLGVDFSMEGHVTSYSSQRVDDQSSYPEVGDGSTGHHDVHDDTLVLEFLWTSMVLGMVSAKEKDHVLQRVRRYRLEGTHILRVWEDGRVWIVPYLAQKRHIV